MMDIVIVAKNSLNLGQGRTDTLTLGNHGPLITTGSSRPLASQDLFQVHVVWEPPHFLFGGCRLRA